jgi:hypothetical protein
MYFLNEMNPSFSTICKHTYSILHRARNAIDLRDRGRKEDRFPWSSFLLYWQKDIKIPFGETSGLDPIWKQFMCKVRKRFLCLEEGGLGALLLAFSPGRSLRFNLWCEEAFPVYTIMHLRNLIQSFNFSQPIYIFCYKRCYVKSLDANCRY